MERSTHRALGLRHGAGLHPRSPSGCGCSQSFGRLAETGLFLDQLLEELRRRAPPAKDDWEHHVALRPPSSVVEVAQRQLPAIEDALHMEASSSIQPTSERWVRNDNSGVFHKVLLGSEAAPRGEAFTYCGWKFSSSPHTLFREFTPGQGNVPCAKCMPGEHAQAKHALASAAAAL